MSNIILSFLTIWHSIVDSANFKNYNIYEPKELGKKGVMIYGK